MWTILAIITPEVELNAGISALFRTFRTELGLRLAVEREIDFGSLFDGSP